MANGQRKQALSYRKFLRTGSLGPLHPTMTLMEVARELGPPNGWLTPEEQVLPLYWGYGRLEIFFKEAAPHQIDFFQLEFIESIEAPGDSLGQAFWLEPDGLHGMMKPSDLLRARLWRQSDVVVSLDVSFRSYLTLQIGGLTVIYNLNQARYPRVEEGQSYRANSWATIHAVDAAQEAMARAMKEASSTGDLARLVALCDATAICDSIYSRPPKPPSTWIKPTAHYHELTGKRYLALLKSGQARV